MVILGKHELAAELVSCLCLLKMTAEPVLKQGLSAIFSWQNPEGSFGDYERLRPIYEGYIKEGFYLHTTSVTLKALALAFQDVYAL